MGIVQEHLDSFPFDSPARVLARREELLLAEALPSPNRPPRVFAPIEAVHFPAEFEPAEFAHPRGVYESDFIRIEWQTMGGFRQPFYHRNCDVDELSYQVYGQRTLMTEHGTVELTAGDFSRIPVTVAHDNYGRDDIHILFYIPAPVREEHPVTRTAELLLPPFPGWEPTTRNELTTECLGGPHHDTIMAPIDEQLLLEQAKLETDRIPVLRPDAAAPGTSWLYRSARVRIGRTVLEPAPEAERVYHRHRNADEIQYQISGRRMLVTQRGTLHLEPGDFTRIPVGVAFTSIATEPSAHITLVSELAVPQVAKGTRTGERVSVDDLGAHR